MGTVHVTIAAAVLQNCFHPKEKNITILIFTMNRTLVLLLGVLLFTSLTCGLKKKYLDSDGDGENDADDDDDDNDGIDDDDDDGDGISDNNDSDDDGDGIDDTTGAGKEIAVSKEKGSAVGGMVFAYFFGVSSFLLKNL